MSERITGKKAAQASQNAFTPVLGPDDELIELGDSPVFDDFQVVRRKFFAHIYEPSITFSKWQFYVNKACLNKFPDVNFVQVLVNRSKKIVALRPCLESACDSLCWCSQSEKRNPRQTTSRGFFALIFPLMGWNLNNRYKVLGKLVHANGMYLLAFDLKTADNYPCVSGEGESIKFSRKPVYSEEEPGSFGITLSEHEKSLQIDLFDDYAIFSVKDTDRQPIAVTAEALGLPSLPTSEIQTPDSPIEKDGDGT